MSDAPEWWLHPRCNAEVERLTRERDLAREESANAWKIINGRADESLLNVGGELSRLAALTREIAEVRAELRHSLDDGEKAVASARKERDRLRATLAQRDEQVRLYKGNVDVLAAEGVALREQVGMLREALNEAADGWPRPNRYDDVLAATAPAAPKDDVDKIADIMRDVAAGDASDQHAPAPQYFEWDCPRCGARNPSTDTHCVCEADQHAPPVMSRSVQRRIAAQKGEPPPTFDGPDAPPEDRR